MTAAERALLRDVFRWAHRNGLEHGASRWTIRGPIQQRWGVDYDPDYIDHRLTIWRGNRSTAHDYCVLSVVEAVDVLCALGILPNTFSSAYQAGITAMRHPRNPTNAALDRATEVPTGDGSRLEPHERALLDQRLAEVDTVVAGILAHRRSGRCDEPDVCPGLGTARYLQTMDCAPLERFALGALIVLANRTAELAQYRTPLPSLDHPWRP